MDAKELRDRKCDAYIVLSTLKGKGGLTMTEASAKLLAEFVRDLPEPEAKSHSAFRSAAP